jgi:hypothetical protein
MSDTIIKFKYYLLDRNGNPTGFMSTKGEFDGEFITLGKDRIPASALIKCMCITDRIALVFAGNPEPIHVAMKIVKGSASKLHRQFNMIASVYQTQAMREHLDQKGRGHEFRAESCPACSCMIDLTRQPATPQVYCPFCEHIATLQNPPPDEKTFQLCSTCGLYSQPKMFTIVYFYFLLVVWGYRYQRKHMCNACARSEAWKMLGANLIFILFVPMAIVQLIRAYAGGAARSTTFQGLDNANAQHKGGKFAAAIREYERIEQRIPAHAGVLYNHALAVQRSSQVSEAADMYERCLGACCNFTPAARQLFGCYQQLGRENDVARLKAIWEEPAEENASPAND